MKKRGYSKADLSDIDSFNDEDFQNTERIVHPLHMRVNKDRRKANKPNRGNNDWDQVTTPPSSSSGARKFPR